MVKARFTAPYTATRRRLALGLLLDVSLHVRERGVTGGAIALAQDPTPLSMTWSPTHVLGSSSTTSN